MGADADRADGGPAARDLVARLRDEVARRVPDGVEVRDTADGFAVGYLEPLVMRGPDGPTSTCLWALVACDPGSMTLRITDALTGSGTSLVDLEHSVVVFRGRMTGDRRVREYGRLPDGSRGLLREQVHSPGLLHAAIREPAAALGWHERQPASAVVGKVVGVTAGVSVLVAGLVIAVLALTGRLG